MLDYSVYIRKPVTIFTLVFDHSMMKLGSSNKNSIMLLHYSHFAKTAAVLESFTDIRATYT